VGTSSAACRRAWDKPTAKAELARAGLDTPDWIALPHATFRELGARAVLEAMVDRIRREHRSGDAVVDLVDLFEAATDESGTAWTAQEIHDELVTVFLAGQETTALALCWALAAIAQHPHVREELEAEVDRVVGPDVLTEAHLPELGYTRMVVEETLRLYPPIWLYTRDALEDDEILGHPVPAGTSVLVSPLATHRRPDLWPDPTRFDPQRFTAEQRKGRHRFAYFPFGGGPRQCIGMHLALHELQIMVAMVAGRFRIELREPVEIGAPVLSLRPLGDVAMRVRLRRPAPALGAPRS
jgi:cytochrome P450